MPTLRKKLAYSLAPNRQRTERLNDSQRQAIVQDVLNGVKHTVLAARYNCHRNTILNTFKRWKELDNFCSRRHFGPKPRLTPRERRLLFRYIRRDPSRRWSDLLWYWEHTIGKKVCKNTIRKAFRSLKLSH